MGADLVEVALSAGGHVAEHDFLGRPAAQGTDDAAAQIQELHPHAHGLEDRKADMLGSAFAGRYAADHLGAVGDGLLGVEGALGAGDALADHLGVLVDEDGH